MAEIVPPAIGAPERRSSGKRLSVVHGRSRAGGRRRTHARSAYSGELGVDVEIAPFFRPPARMAAAQLVISRSGASTVASFPSNT